MLLLGDININTRNLPKDHPNSMPCKYSNLLSSFGFEVTNDRITRPVSGTIIDHVVSNFSYDYSITNSTIENNLSDHNIIISSIGVQVASSDLFITKIINDLHKIDKLLVQILDQIDY